MITAGNNAAGSSPEASAMTPTEKLADVDVLKRLRCLQRADENNEVVSFVRDIWKCAADEIERLQAVSTDRALTPPSKEQIEEAAKIIYAVFPYNGPDIKPAWVEHGNSFVQGDARRAAIAVLSLCPKGSSEPVAGALDAERDAIANEARRYASHYPQSSDGRNTFILLAEWIEARSSQGGEPTLTGSDDALRMARHLANVLWERHYSNSAPQWKVNDDLVGVVLQLDNMTAGMNQRIEAAVSALKSCDCPGGGWTGMPDDVAPTVENCLAAGACGCDIGFAACQGEDREVPRLTSGEPCR